MQLGRMVVAGLVAAAPAGAEVVEAAPDHFVIETGTAIAAPPAAVWNRLVRPAQWWDPEHSYSGDAAGLSIQPEPGGCFCERLPNGGGVEHARVVYASPGELLRITGALGPLQAEAVTGVLSFTLAAEGKGTRLTARYAVSGHISRGGREMAGHVDEVLTHQLARLRKAAEDGRPAR